MLQTAYFKPVMTEGTSVLESEFSISKALSSIPSTSPVAIRDIVFLFKYQRHLLSTLFHPQVVDQRLPSGSEMSSEETECLWGKDGAMLKFYQLFPKLGMMSWDVSLFMLPDFQSLSGALTCLSQFLFFSAPPANSTFCLPPSSSRNDFQVFPNTHIFIGPKRI